MRDTLRALCLARAQHCITAAELCSIDGYCSRPSLHCSVSLLPSSLLPRPGRLQQVWTEWEAGAELVLHQKPVDTTLNDLEREELTTEHHNHIRLKVWISGKIST